jgi:hypothetical protein
MATTAKFEINGVVDTSQPVLENINTLANASGVFVTWDPSAGSWSVIKNDVGTAVMNFNDSNIIGNINISGSGINDMYNAVTIEYPHQDLRDTRDYIDLEIPSEQRYPQELDNKLEIKLDCINNPVQAQLIASRELKQSRVDKIITFSTSYLGNGLSAGDLISVTSTMYAYTAKVFRIITIQEDDNDESGIVYQITALEYDAGVYSTAGLVRKERNKKTGIVPKNANQVVMASDAQANLNLSLTNNAILQGLALYFSAEALQWIIDFRGRQVQLPPNTNVNQVGLIVKWTFEDGLDLDIRCRIVQPNVGQNDLNSSLGYTGGDGSQFPAQSTRYWPLTGTPIISWGGDNTGTGQESVLLDVGAFKSYFPGERYVILECKGNWYTTQGIRPVKLTAELYVGGTYNLSGFTFVNTGYQFGRVLDGLETYITSKFGSEDDNAGERAPGDLMGYLIVDTQELTAQFSNSLGGI